jgi:peptidoglycan/xylan/chitin deacetylase (PgdA/CDA1 family)
MVAAAMSTPISRRRWYAKKLLRAGCAALHWPTAVGGLPGTGPVRALTYHAFGDQLRDPFCVRAADFDRHMAWVAEHGLAVTLADVEAFLAGKKPLVPGSVLVTIDDGVASVHTAALPVIKRYCIPAVIYLTVGLIEPQRHAAPRMAGGHVYLNRRQLEDLVDAGIEIGSHAYTHRSLASLAEHEALDEACRSRDRLEAWLGRRVVSFAYPFGTRADFSPATARVLSQAGYRTACTSQHGALRPGLDPLSLPRNKVEGGEPQWMFRALCQGALDKWRWVDHALWRMQQAGKRPTEPAQMPADSDP